MGVRKRESLVLRERARGTLPKTWMGARPESILLNKAQNRVSRCTSHTEGRVGKGSEVWKCCMCWEKVWRGSRVEKTRQMSRDGKTDKGHIEEDLLEVLRRLILYHRTSVS